MLAFEAGHLEHSEHLHERRETVAEFRWLPRKRIWRVVLGALGVGSLALTLAAYLRPNMAFDLANMIFCG